MPRAATGRPNGRPRSIDIADLPAIGLTIEDQARRLDAFCGSVLLLKAIRRHHEEARGAGMSRPPEPDARGLPGTRALHREGTSHG